MEQQVRAQSSGGPSVWYRAKHILAVAFKYISLVIGAFVALLPLVTCVIAAFKTPEQFKTSGILEIPGNIFKFFTNIENFQIAWDRGMLDGFKNSFLIVIVVLIGSVMIGSMLAYVLSRFKFPGNGLIRQMFLIATLIPGISTQIVIYKIMNTLGWIDSTIGYMIMQMGTDVISIYVFLQFFENLSISMDESAILDGASYFQVFYKILFPLLKPAMVTVAILKGVSVYNEYYASLLYLTTDSKRTITAVLFSFKGPMGSKFYLICAGALLTILPAIIIFLLCQKQIYSGVAAGSVKG